jgi:two-component system, OmpR family, manganese sensing sensor histidine kinase
LSLGTSLMVGIVAAIGWFLSGLAMAPIRDSYQRLKQFTADASHELRNPIAVIQTNVQVALSDPEADPEMQRHHLEVIERLTRRLGRLVDDLLFLARQDSGIVQPRWCTIDLKDLCTEVLEEQRPFATEKAITLIVNFEPPDPTALPEKEDSTPLPVKSLSTKLAAGNGSISQEGLILQGDRDQISRLLTNLVSNAVKYTPASGKVILSLQTLKRSGISHIQAQVMDTGIGIPAESLSHIFDRFYRIDPARSQIVNSGSGLGLAIAQVIVENHHGTIQISSQVNQGTTVTVILPQQQSMTIDL